MQNIYFVSYLVGSALLVYELGLFSSGTIPMDGSSASKFFWTTLFNFPILIHLYNLLSSVSVTSSKMMVLLILSHCHLDCALAESWRTD